MFTRNYSPGKALFSHGQLSEAETWPADNQALIVDAGTSEWRVSLSDDDAPERLPVASSSRVFTNGALASDAAFDAMLTRALDAVKKKHGAGAWAPFDTPRTVLSVPLLCTRATHERAAELLFETHRAPFALLNHNAFLSCFGLEVDTALLVEVGADSTCVVPLVGGFVFDEGLVRSAAIGGEQLSAAIAARAKLSLDDAEKAKRAFAAAAAAAVDGDGEKKKTDGGGGGGGGNDDAVSRACADAITALLFEPPTNEHESLASLVVRSIVAAGDKQTGAQLLDNIYLVGSGAATLPGVAARLERALRADARLAGRRAARVVNRDLLVDAALSDERARAPHLTWFGALVFSSLSTVDNYYLSRAQYTEHGRAATLGDRFYMCVRDDDDARAASRLATRECERCATLLPASSRAALDDHALVCTRRAKTPACTDDYDVACPFAALKDGDGGAAGGCAFAGRRSQLVRHFDDAHDGDDLFPGLTTRVVVETDEGQALLGQ